MSTKQVPLFETLSLLDTQGNLYPATNFLTRASSHYDGMYDYGQVYDLSSGEWLQIFSAECGMTYDDVPRFYVVSSEDLRVLTTALNKVDLNIDAAKIEDRGLEELSDRDPFTINSRKAFFARLRDGLEKTRSENSPVFLSGFNERFVEGRYGEWGDQRCGVFSAAMVGRYNAVRSGVYGQAAARLREHFSSYGAQVAVRGPGKETDPCVVVDFPMFRETIMKAMASKKPDHLTICDLPDNIRLRYTSGSLAF